VLNGTLPGRLVLTVHAEPGIVIDHGQPVIPPEVRIPGVTGTGPDAVDLLSETSAQYRCPAALGAVLLQRLPPVVMNGDCNFKGSVALSVVTLRRLTREGSGDEGVRSRRGRTSAV
jgi:hypothetical protein